MTLTCNTIQDLLPLWADDVLHPGSREEVEAHLAACPACRKKADGLRPQTQETSLPPLPVPARQKRRRLVGLALAVLAVVIAVCRVVTGVHYVSDVLAGLAFGTVLSVLGWNAFVLAASALGFYAIMLL